MTRDQTSPLHFKTVLLADGWADNVRLTLRSGRVAFIERDVAAGVDDERHAFAIPGMPNLHSHAFQRGMAGLAETQGPSADSFWTWRETMYRFVDRISPEDVAAIAALAYAEMLESGFTRVGEFHYLHHDRDGSPYSDPATMSAAIVEAASETGIALTHLPVFYAHSGFGGMDPGSGQRRFVHSIDSFAALIERLGPMLATIPDAVLGVAPHSLRAVVPEELAILPALLDAGPIHIHIAEQVREVEDCKAWSGVRPVEWLLRTMDVDARWCLVHATHMNEDETVALARAQAVAGLCPITEANLGDGLFPIDLFQETGGLYGVGSDSNVLISMAEELRLLEYGQRLATQSRNRLARGAGSATGGDIYLSALAGGGQALGVAPGIALGNPADIVSLDMDHPSLFGKDRAQALDALVFATARSAVDCVWRGGRKVVAHGEHYRRAPIVRRYRKTLAQLLA